MNTILTFLEWTCLEEARRQLLDPGVIQGYNAALDAELEKVIGQTQSPELRHVLKSTRGFGWAQYILAAIGQRDDLRRVDVDDALQYIVFHLLSRTGENRQVRSNLFDLDVKNYQPSMGNPLVARFKSIVSNDVASIVAGKIPRVLKVHRPHGTQTIGMEPGDARPEWIAGRSSQDDQELIGDLMSVLSATKSDLPLTDVFRSMLAGENLRVRWGRKGAAARNVIRGIVKDYATSTGNHQILRLLNGDAPHREKSKSKREPSQTADFQSIVGLIQKSRSRSISASALTSKRRRWLDYAPRDPQSPEKNRLNDTLAAMIRQGVLVKSGGMYAPGPRFQEFSDLHDQVPSGR